jgi:hypothetical protein
MCLIGFGGLFALVQGLHLRFGDHALRFRSGLSLEASRGRLSFCFDALVLRLDLCLDPLDFRLANSVLVDLNSVADLAGQMDGNPT